MNVGQLKQKLAGIADNYEVVPTMITLDGQVFTGTIGTEPDEGEAAEDPVYIDDTDPDDVFVAIDIFETEEEDEEEVAIVAEGSAS